MHMCARLHPRVEVDAVEVEESPYISRREGSASRTEECTGSVMVAAVSIRRLWEMCKDGLGRVVVAKELYA